MTFPPPIPCPSCGKSISVHIFFKAHFCHRCCALVPLPQAEFEKCLRDIPAEGKRSFIPPERQRVIEDIPSEPMPVFDRPFPLEMPRPEHKKINPSWSDVRFPGDFIRIFDYAPPATDNCDTDFLVRDAVRLPDPPKPPTDEEAKDAFIRLLRQKCGRKV